jgi:hypothetical protein
MRHARLMVPERRRACAEGGWDGRKGSRGRFFWGCVVVVQTSRHFPTGVVGTANGPPVLAASRLRMAAQPTGRVPSASTTRGGIAQRAMRSRLAAS